MKIHKLTAIIFALAFVLIHALPSAAQDREDYKAGGEYASDFCALEPDSEDGLLGALVASDVFNYLFTLSDSKLKSLSGDDLNQLAEEKASAHRLELGSKEFASCENTGLEMFDCMDFYFYMAKDISPKKASRKEIESVFYDLAQAGGQLGADGLCGKVDMVFTLKGDSEKSSAGVVIYKFEDEWYPLLVY